MAYKIVNDDSLTSVANAIRVQGSISGTLEFPDGFVSAIQNLSPSGNDALVITLTDSAAVSETYGYHWTPDCSYNDYYEAVIQRRPIGLKVNCTICGDAYACRINNSENWLEYKIVEEVVDANDNPIGLVYKYYKFTYGGVTLNNEFFIPYVWDADATASDVASGKIFYSSNGRGVGTATPPSGTYSITSNGIYDIVSFASVDVNVSGDHDAEDGMVTRALSEYSNSRVTTIGEYAFAACSNLTTANFPNVVSIYASAFQSCSGLTTISIPQATVISNNAFANCFSLTTANIPNVTNVGSYAFYCCSRLTTVSFPNVTNVGSYAFYNCSSLTAVSFPNATSINEYAFYGCNKLNTLNIPNAITIGNAAFQNCRSLTTASLPKITFISGTAFRSCSILTSVYILASSIVSLGSASAFASTPMWSSTYTGSWGSIYVPASLVDSYKSAKNWSAYAERITAYTE